MKPVNKVIGRESERGRRRTEDSEGGWELFSVYKFD